MIKMVFFVIAAIVLFVNCGKAPTSASVIASETWRLNDVGTQNYADIILSKGSVKNLSHIS